MNRYFYRGLRFRMTLLFSLVFIFINLFFGSITYRYFRNGYIENYNKYLFSRAQTQIDKTEINPDIIALPDSGESIRVFYHNNERQTVLVFQSPGVVSKLQVPYKTGITDSLGQYGVYLKKENYDGRPVELLLSVSNQALKKKINSFTILMIGLTLMSVLLSAVSAYLASGWLLKPIRSIARQAAQIHTGQLGKRIFSGETHDELQQLAQTINDMIGRIEQEHQASNTFFAAASHELRTPLSNLRAQTELELANRTSKADQELLLSQLAEISRLQSIVEQFLLISEFNQNGISLRKSTVDISEQLLRVFSRNNPQATLRNIRPDIRFSEQIGSFEIVADAGKLEMVWQNLIQNALKYATAESILLCLITREGQNLIVTFENSIAYERIDLTELGEPFTKGRTLASGSGLGLWLCKEILEAHNAILTLKSEDHYFRAAVSIPISG